MPSRQALAKKVADALTNRFERKKRVSRATITAVQVDAAGRVIGATGTVDGLSAQRLYVDHGSNLQVGDTLEVLNRGGAAAPAFYALRRVHTTIPVPTLPYGTDLPVPYGLELQAGTYVPNPGGSYTGYIDAQWRRIDSVYGSVSYQVECRRNDVTEDDPFIWTVPGFGGISSLPVAITDSGTLIPYNIMVADYSFTPHGVIKLAGELIYYSAMTRSGGCEFLYPYTLDTSAFYLLDYVEDSFTDTDTTDIVSHTPDYDRQAGGWAAVPTKPSNWAISGNKVVASPGTDPANAIIRANAVGWSNVRMRGDWTWPSSAGNFGYLFGVGSGHYASVLMKQGDDPGEQYLTIYESGVQVWSQKLATALFIAGETYKLEAMCIGKTVYLRAYDDSTPANPVLAMSIQDILPTTMSGDYFAIFSDVAVTLDNFFMDDARFKDFADDDWINFAYYATGQTMRKVTDNGYNATLHRHEFTLDGAPGASGGALYPTFYNCTRGYSGTSAAAHTADTGINGQTLGVSMKYLDPGVDYNVRVRAYKTEDVLSAWTDWHSITTSYDTVPPTDPTGFSIAELPSALEFSWTGPSIDTVADLAGFKIYYATSSTGTGATEWLSVPAPALSFIAYLPSGTERYYNIKAFDNDGNLSDYGEATWPSAKSLFPPSGTNLLLNADFERPNASQTWPFSWNNGGTCTKLWGTDYFGYYFGYYDGYGVYYSATDGQNGTLLWPLSSESWLVKAETKNAYTASILLRFDDSDTVPSIPDDINWDFHTATGGTHPDGKYTISVAFQCWNDAGPSSFMGARTMSDINVAYEELEDDWWRVGMTTVVTTTDTQSGSYPYLMMCVQIYNEMGSTVSISFDRPKLEKSASMTDWSPGIVPVGGGSQRGLLIDGASIRVSDGTFDLRDTGKIHSHLVPGVDATYDLGIVTTNEWRAIYLSDDLVAGDLVSADRVQVGSPTAPGANELAVEGAIAAEGGLNVTGNIVVSGTVDGVDVANHDARHITGGADQIDGDKLDIDWTPSNYTPSTAPAEADNVDNLTAHLYGIDQAIGGAVVNSYYANNTGNVTITTTYSSFTTICSVAISVPTGHRAMIIAHASLYMSAQTSDQLEYIRVSDGTTTREARFALGTASAWRRNSSGVTFLSTKTGSYTVYLQAAKGDSDNTVVAEGNCCNLAVLVYEEA